LEVCHDTTKVDPAKTGAMVAKRPFCHGGYLHLYRSAKQIDGFKFKAEQLN